jgi:O-antigen ligase
VKTPASYALRLQALTPQRVRRGVPPATLAVGLGLAIGYLVLTLKPVHAAAGAALAAVATGAFWQPFLGALAYVLVQFLRPGEVIPALAAYRPERFLIAVLLASLAASLVAGGRRGFIGRHRLHAAVLGLLVAIAASVPLSVWKYNSAVATVQFAKMVVGYFVLLAVVRTRRQLHWVSWAFLLSVGYQALWSYRGFHTGEDVAFAQGIYRAIGMTDSFGDANTLAGLLIAGLPFAFVFALHGRRPGLRLLAAAIGMLLMITVPLTGSRAGFIGLAGVLVILPFASQRRVVSAGGIVAIATVMWLVTPAQQQERMRSILTYSKEETYVERTGGWQIGRQMFLDHPLFGVGAGNFGLARHELYGASWLNAHSVYYQVLGETGAIGGVTFGCFIVILLTTQAAIRRRLRDAPAEWRVDYYLAWAMSLAIWTRLITGLAGHNLASFTYYFVAALTVVLDRLVCTARSSDTLSTVDGTEVLR